MEKLYLQLVTLLPGPSLARGISSPGLSMRGKGVSSGEPWGGPSLSFGSDSPA